MTVLDNSKSRQAAIKTIGLFEMSPAKANFGQVFPKY